MQVFNPSNPYAFTGYPIEQEDHGFLQAYGAPQYFAWRNTLDNYSIPIADEIDPREWEDVLNQRQQGACQGFAAAASGAFATYLDTGQEVHLSSGFAYYASQEFDGIRGDSGSTLSGGTKALARGIPLESSFPYRPSYNDGIASYRSQKSQLLSDTAKLYKCTGAIPLRNAGEVADFIFTKSGFVQIGIRWTVPNAWELKSYRGGRGGGHSIVLGGGLKVSSWESGRGILAKNSWDLSWGRNGWGLWSLPAIQSMIESGGTFIGRSTTTNPLQRYVPNL